MKVENLTALNYLLQDEIYLLDQEKYLFVEVEEMAIAEEGAAPIEFKYLGKNRQQFLILVHYPEHEHIRDIHLTALENILKRKELLLDDVAIVNMYAHMEAELAHLVTHFSPAKLLVLGERSMPAGLSVPVLNQPVKQNSFQLLYSFNFDDMMDSNDKKKLFWEQMKTL